MKMKRFIFTTCLLVGASVASYAGAITGTAGTNLAGPNSALQNFDGIAVGSFPLASLTNFTLSAGSTSTQVTVSTNGNTSVDGGTTNSGVNGQVRSDANVLNNFGGTLGGSYISTYTGGPLDAGSSFIRNLMFTFNTPVSQVLLDYFASDSSLNYFVVNGLASTKTFLSNQTCNGSACLGSGLQAGYIADGTVTSISSITFTMVGLDNNAFVTGGDIVLFDNLRVVGGAAGTSGPSGPSGPNGPGDGDGVIPEPSTYALMGAGLLALGYARRKK